MSDLYKRIEDLCVARNITITDMCRDSGAPRGSLTDLKKGRTDNLHTKTLSKISAYFGVSVDELLGEETKKQPLVNDEELSDNMRKLIEFARTVPEDKADMILRVLRSIVESG